MTVWTICAASLLRLIKEEYKARAEFRHELLEQFTARRLTLWPSQFTGEWIVERNGIELARNESWELAIQEALSALSDQKAYP